MKTRLILMSLLCLGMLSCKDYPQGALRGVFSVSENKKVVFSQGNLQYQASTSTWRFAENQYDYIGESNENISATYDGWIDLFGWGTGDNPTNTSTNSIDYLTFVDWGNNAISNGGNKKELWRTLTYYEWSYLLNSRSLSLYSLASVMGVKGLIILPDDWDAPEGVSYSPTTSDYTTNVYGESKWKLMEEAGAVFLPDAGIRDGTVERNDGYLGGIWSSSEKGKSNAYELSFSLNLVFTGNCYRYYGQSVRLCSEVK